MPVISTLFLTALSSLTGEYSDRRFFSGMASNSARLDLLLTYNKVNTAQLNSQRLGDSSLQSNDVILRRSEFCVQQRSLFHQEKLRFHHTKRYRTGKAIANGKTVSIFLSYSRHPVRWEISPTQRKIACALSFIGTSLHIFEVELYLCTKS